MHHPTLSTGWRALLAATVVAAATTVPLSGGPAAAAPTTDRQQQYTAAATEYGVPAVVLLGVSYLESRWDTNAGTPSTSGGYGPMHLTDARHVAALPGRGHHDAGAEDPRGDDSRPARVPATRPVEAPAPSTAALQTMDAAATLTGATPEALRTDAGLNIRGGAALLSAYQRDLGAPVGADTDPAAWYGAVARYSGADSADAAAAFADEVFTTIGAGEARVTDDGQRVTLPARVVRPERSWLDRLGLRRLARPDGVECPRTISCEWIPAPYEAFGDGDYGNHDLSDRPARQKIEYIVIHDTEASWATTLKLVQDPTYVSWHYSLRSVDGHIAQHVKTKDVGWHAGNWYVNAKSIGLEHEGFAAQGTWYTEAMYRTSAKLVRHLALRLGIPLDRQHIIGHDNVPGTIASTVRGMHWDPGPYWDWTHYFDLLHAPRLDTGTPATGMVRIDPDYTTNQPAFTDCVTPGVPCAPRGSSSVVLRSAPSADAPLVNDIALRPDGSPNTMVVSDHGARASAGQTYALAGRQGDWTAIWYLGQRAWFHNPASAATASWTVGVVATPKPGRTTVPVYGRAYPEQSAYPEGVPYQAISPLQYTLAAGQRYAVGAVLAGEYYRASTFDGSSPGDWTVIRGKNRYAQIQFGHRIMYVDLADVQLLPSPVGAPR
ncbi:N-acetylmuramoyl-L-alanine amidase [Micromonospora saelicesensis]|uniref:N-acetylmuramoyl-L-alanine amidase n=1 Tax=Micromonospora saelicesensis TaxID=285676 RepID=A0A1C4V4H5_9ACTN|nr:peptidoglycan recognition family protein [Micromonospora saelicesensis]SCE78873.1 N-acetylmuramoyl-L-alanine amidase [Micromonospora saelicesensis]